MRCATIVLTMITINRMVVKKLRRASVFLNSRVPGYLNVLTFVRSISYSVCGGEVVAVTRCPHGLVT